MAGGILNTSNGRGTGKSNNSDDHKQSEKNASDLKRYRKWSKETLIDQRTILAIAEFIEDDYSDRELNEIMEVICSELEPQINTEKHDPKSRRLQWTLPAKMNVERVSFAKINGFRSPFCWQSRIRKDDTDTAAIFLRRNLRHVLSQCVIHKKGCSMVSRFDDSWSVNRLRSSQKHSRKCQKQFEKHRSRFDSEEDYVADLACIPAIRAVPYDEIDKDTRLEKLDKDDALLLSRNPKRMLSEVVCTSDDTSTISVRKSRRLNNSDHISIPNSPDRNAESSSVDRGTKHGRTSVEENTFVYSDSSDTESGLLEHQFSSLVSPTPFGLPIPDTKSSASPSITDMFGSLTADTPEISKSLLDPGGSTSKKGKTKRVRPSSRVACVNPESRRRSSSKRKRRTVDQLDNDLNPTDFGSTFVQNRRRSLRLLHD